MTSIQNTFSNAVGMQSKLHLEFSFFPLDKFKRIHDVKNKQMNVDVGQFKYM